MDQKEAFLAAGIDFEETSRRLGGDERLLLKLFSIFMGYGPKFTKLKELYLESDHEELGNLLHQLKGSVSNLGAVKIVAMIEEMQQGNIDAKKLDELNELFEKAKNVVQEYLEDKDEV